MRRYLSARGNATIKGRSSRSRHNPVRWPPPSERLQGFFGVAPNQGREVVSPSRKPTKAGGARAFQPKDATKGFDEVMEVMPELLRPFLAMAMTALGSRKTRPRLVET